MIKIMLYRIIIMVTMINMSEPSIILSIRVIKSGIKQLGGNV